MSLNIFLRNLALFFFFGLLQILFLNNITVSQLGITPFVYVVAILLMPFETPSWFSLLFAFFLGLSIDIFSDTGGMHAFSLVFAVVLRPIAIRLVEPRKGYELSDRPGVFGLGFKWFLNYMLMLLAVHHISFFLLDNFSFSLFISGFLSLIFTYIFSAVLILLSQFLIFRS